ncbi:protein PHTF2-like [Styela clava]
MDSMLSWYQRKIGAYDLQIWERAVEIREQQDSGMKSMDKRSSSVKPDLIDIDLVRGSTFSKNKPQYSWLVVTCQAFIRVSFLPLYAKWWIQQSSKPITLLFFLMYILQFVVFFIYFNGTEEEFKYISTSEIMMPSIVMFLLGSVHCHVVSTNFRLNVRNDSRKMKKSRTLSSALLEPVVCSSSTSHQSTLSLLTSTFTNKGKDSTENNNHCSNGISKCSSEHSDAESDTPLLKDENVKSSTVHENGKINASQEQLPIVEQSEESLNITNMKNGDIQHKSVADCDKSTDNKKDDFKCLRQSSVDRESDEISTDSVENKKHGRHGNRLENLNSTSSSSNSSEQSGGSDSESTSTNDNKTRYNKKARKDNYSATVLLPGSGPRVDRISVKIWESNQCKKVQASLLDIGGIIRKKVQNAFSPSDMFFIGFCFAILISSIPTLYRICFHQNANNSATSHTGSTMEFVKGLAESLFMVTHGNTTNFKVIFVIYATAMKRFIFSFTFFVMLCAAHKTFRQRLLFAKYFSHLTSSRRAKKSDVPHFRLDKVENVRLWLSLRSYLRRRGPQRSVDVIVSSAFFLSLFLLCFISLQLLHDTDLYLSSLIFWEMTAWLLALAIFLLNFMTIGAQINRKYSNTSMLLTEQINLYLQMKQKPNKREELQRANSVLSIASKLIKEIEMPFNIYGLAMNPLLYNITRVVVLSAFSGVISEILGFKLKIWKIKP